jgi:hypothetical protein
MGCYRTSQSHGGIPALGYEGFLGGVSDNRNGGGGITWPDWRGQVVAIIASGPSAAKADIAALKRCKVIAIKQNVDLAPWADVVYGCDPAWWKHRQGLPDFSGLKIAWEGSRLDDYPDIHRVKIPERPKANRDKYIDDLVLDPVGTVGAGGNSGYQALNLAIQFGSRRIILIGFDMTDRNGVHWYGRNFWPMANNPMDSNFRRWIAAFEKAAPILRDIGAEVINASPHSALSCFPKQSIEQALKDWE